MSAKWDLEGVGTYPDAAELGDPTSETVHVAATHAFSQPGTYFPALRVAAQREGNASTPFARSQNLGRVRVMVTERIDEQRNELAPAPTAEAKVASEGYAPGSRCRTKNDSAESFSKTGTWT